MEVFYGGYCRITNPEIVKGKYAKDFGTGFYCALLKEQASRWAKRYSTPMINVYDFSPSDRCTILNFEDMTEEWLDFIVDCRNGVTHNYDIVSGAMANDQIYNYISDYVNGVITREQFWVLAKFKHPTLQVCFCSLAALNCLTFKDSEEAAK